MHMNTSIEICTQRISLHQCRASLFHIDDVMNKQQISCPLWTSPTCVQTQSPHPHTNIHICTLQITNVLYIYTALQHTYLSFTQNFPTLLSSLVYTHLQKHNKCTFTSCKQGTLTCSSWPHISHTFIRHPRPPCSMPHRACPPSLTHCKIYTVYASCLIPHCDAHTRFYASEHIHTLVYPQGHCWPADCNEEKPFDTITSKMWKWGFWTDSCLV